jgi:hypothetical protein
VTDVRRGFYRLPLLGIPKKGVCVHENFGTGRRPTVKGTAAERMVFLRRLALDDRLKALSGAAQGLVLHAAIVHADGEGKCFHSVDDWAAETGRDPKTVRAAVKAAEAAGLLTSTPHMLNGRQTTNTYRFDRALVETVDPDAPGERGRGDANG